MANDKFVDVDDIIYEDRDGGIEIEKLINKKSEESKKTVSEFRETPKEETIKVKEGKITYEEKKPEPRKEEPKKIEKKAVVPPVQKKSVPKKKAVKKAPTKKEPQKTVKKAPKKKDSSANSWLLIALSAIVVVAVVVILFFVFKAVNPTTETNKVAAVVNGVPIYESELEARFNLLTTTNSPLITREQTLNTIVEEQLLVQEATKKGITTSDEEVEALLDQIMISNGITIDVLKDDLVQRGSDYDTLYKLYKNTLTLNKLINETIISKTNTSDEELRKFYDVNKDKLAQPATVTIEHILIMFGNMTENETYAKAEEVKNLINTDKSNFCDLVKKHTEDLGSVDTCGEYIFSQADPFVPEFIESGFDMDVGEVRIVKSQFGYHIMYKTTMTPAGVPAFNDIKADLERIVAQEKNLDSYNNLVTTLRMSAIIEIYNSTETAPTEEQKMDFLVNEGQNTGEVAEAKQDVKKTEEVNPTKETVPTEESKKLSLAKCLGDKKAQLFTAYWCPHCQDQKDMFESYISYVDVVECDPQGENPRVSECQAAGITNLPTWIIGGKKYVGTQTLTKLADISGCEY